MVFQRVWVNWQFFLKAITAVHWKLDLINLFKWEKNKLLIFEILCQRSIYFVIFECCDLLISMGFAESWVIPAQLQTNSKLRVLIAFLWDFTQFFLFNWEESLNKYSVSIWALKKQQLAIMLSLIFLLASVTALGIVLIIAKSFPNQVLIKSFWLLKIWWYFVDNFFFPICRARWSMWETG